jgi:MFS family permease
MGNGSIDGYVRRITIIAALGGFLFGYDTGVISGALIYIAPDFDLGNFGQQAVVASLLLGAVVGSLGSGKLTDGLGRRHTLLITAGVFAAGALASAVSPSAAALIGSRFVIGLALGASSTAVPLSLTVLTLISTITTTGTFWLYAAFALASFFYLRKYLQETRGPSLEEVDTELQRQASASFRTNTPLRGHLRIGFPDC